MTTTLHHEITKLRAEAASAARAAALLEPISDQLDGFNLANLTSYYVNTREAVQAIMSRFPGVIWTKRADGESIRYEHTTDTGHEHVIAAYAAALPPTCRVEYTEETITRRVPVIRCTPAVPEASEAVAVL